jgi:SAM-dependent methyltransferase
MTDTHAHAHTHHGATAPSGAGGPHTGAQWDAMYASKPRRDTGRPQPTFLALAAAGAIHGRVLDVGCGTGEHAPMCASLGLDATGAGLSNVALHAADDKARDRGLTARFINLDVRHLAELGESFDTVLDPGLFHIFTGDDRAACLDSLRSEVPPGGRYFMLCFRDQPSGPGPGGLAREEITAAFTEGWRADSIEADRLDSATDPDGIAAWLVALTRIEPPPRPHRARETRREARC